MLIKNIPFVSSPSVSDYIQPSRICNLNIFHQNIQSLRAKLSQLEILLSKDNTDILCFSETYLKSQNVGIIQLPGYKLAACFCRSKSRGGVAIYVKNNINFNSLHCIESLSMYFNFECCGISLPELNCIIVCVYRTPDSNFNIFIKSLEALLQKIVIRSRHVKKKVIITGDFNVDILENTKRTSVFKNTLLKYNLTLTINEPTRITLRSKTCLDNIITNFKNYSSKVLHLALSDHSAQTISVPCDQGFVEKYWFYYSRNVDKHLTLFLKHLSQLSFSEVYQCQDVQSAYSTFIELFKLIYDLCVPIERSRLTYNKKHNWQTKGIKRASKVKRKLHNNIFHNNNNNNKKSSSSFTHYYKKYCKILKSVIRSAKQQYNISFINNNSNKNKATWNLVKRQTTPQNTFKSTIQNVTEDNGTDVSDVYKIAEIFNKHFVLPASGITNNKPKHTYNRNSSNRPLSKTLFLTPIDEYELEKIVKSLKNKRSCGYDDIPVKVIKSSLEIIIKPLVYILNLMIESGSFPQELKLAKVKPLFKKGNKSNKNNYRAISLLPSFSKIFEKIIYHRLLNFLNKYNLLNKDQYGFQKQKSTTHAVYKVLKEIWESLNNKTPCIGLFLDMSKAFDCVRHDILLQKLENLGVRGLALKLIQSYLTDRKQFTVIDSYNKNSKTFEEIQSSTEHITLGLPQGSILGPLLFLVYVDELPNITENLCVMFADDATIFIPDTYRNKTAFEDHINKVLETTISWLKSINLTVNLSKTKFIQFRNNRSLSYNLDISENNTKINEVGELNFLGVTIDANLNWKDHISKINQKISSYCYVLSILAETTSVDVTRAAYFGQVYPLLLYGIIFWGNSVNVESTFLLQKRCLRIIHRMYSDETLRNIFRDKGYLTLTNIFILESVIFIKRNPNYFISKISSRPNIRSKYKHDICIPKINNHLYHKSAFSTGIKIFNHLPGDIKALDLPKIKYVLKKWLINNVFYTLDEYYTSKH